MKLVVLLTILAVTAVSSEKSPAITLRDYLTTFGNGRIINGNQAFTGQFPWQVLITYLMPSAGLTGYCGGALISNQWILTAAHCVKGFTNFTVKLGALNFYGAEEGVVEVKITKLQPLYHIGYDDAYLYNDIALIKMDNPVQFTNKITPVQLPWRGEEMIAGEHVKVSGWGRTSDNGHESYVLNYVDLVTVANNDCANYYIDGMIVDTTLCTTGCPYQNTCKGDSGGPLVHYNRNGVPTHHGIVSFVSKTSCEAGIPSGFVRTESYLDWIAEQTALNV